MKNIIYLLSIIINIGCQSQTKDTLTTKTNTTMERFDIIKFEKFKDNLDRYYFETPNGEKVNQSVSYTGSKESKKIYFYQEELSKEDSRIRYIKTFYPNGNIRSKSQEFKERFLIGISYEYDSIGEVIKTTDYDAPFIFDFDQLEKYIKQREIPQKDSKYGISRTGANEFENPRWTIFFIDRQIGKRIIIILDGRTGERLHEEQRVIRWEKSYGSEPIPIIIYDKAQEIKKSSSVYKTHQGKNYTESEWKTYEQQQYNEHLHKTGRADLIKPTEIPKANTEKSLLADEDDVKPEKKKGFLGGLFS